MNILFTVSTYKPHLDGIQAVTTYLAEGLISKGHQVDVITCAYPQLTSVNEEVIDGVRITRMQAKPKSKFSLGKGEEFQKEIMDRQSRYDVMINVASQSAFTEWSLPIMERIKVPMVLHLHSMWNFAILKSDLRGLKPLLSKLYGNIRWGWYYLRYAKAFSRYSTVLQLHEKDHACRFFKRFYGIDSTILENAVEDSFFYHDGIQKKKTIVYVANYMKGKNQKRCVDLFMRSKIPEDWTLLLLGSKKSAYYRELRSYCEKRYPDAIDKRIQLLVGLERARLCEIVKESSLFMMTSLVEAFPISIIEGMAAKTPYISTDVGIVKYLNGGVIAHSDEEFIAYLQKYTQNDVARENMAQQAYEEALRHYRVEDKVDQLEKLLLRLCKQ